MDVGRSIQMAIETGKVVIGSNRIVKDTRLGKLKLIILSSDCPEDRGDEIRHLASLSMIPIYTFEGSSVHLGTVCGKLFRVAALGIKDPGTSKILELRESCQEKESG
ncbi:MAG: 50S ribosomal protein L30e [Candidatus Bathyarchaeia archaeon]